MQFIYFAFKFSYRGVIGCIIQVLRIIQIHTPIYAKVYDKRMTCGIKYLYSNDLN